MRIDLPPSSPSPNPGPQYRPPGGEPPPAPANLRFSSYADALAYCSIGGYENPDIVNVVLEKTRIFRDKLASKREHMALDTQTTFGLCSLLSAAGSNPIRVLDFGGACGAHYFTARALIPASTRLEWVVVETPDMARRAGAVLSTQELRFSPDLRAAADSLPSIDLLYTSGALQCVDRPYEYLDTLLALPARNYLFNRLGLTSGERDVFTLHESRLSSNGPGPMPPGIGDKLVRYPYVFPRLNRVLQTIAMSCEIVATFEDSSGLIQVDNEPLVGFGLLAKRR